MDFRRGKYKYELNEPAKNPDNKDNAPKTVYTYKGNKGLILTCSVENDTTPDDVIAQRFSLTANLKGNTIGTIAGVVISPLEILDDPHDPYLWCDAENGLLPDLYTCLLRYVLPMEYVRLFERHVTREDAEKAKVVSRKLYDFLCETDYMYSYVALINHASVEEKYRNSGLFSVMFSTLNEVFDLCGTAICINPMEKSDEHDGGKIWSYNDSEKEKARMIKMAEHYGFTIAHDFLHNTTGEDTMIAVRSSDYLEEFLEGENFSEQL